MASEVQFRIEQVPNQAGRFRVALGSLMVTGYDPKLAQKLANRRAKKGEENPLGSRRRSCFIIMIIVIIFCAVFHENY